METTPETCVLFSALQLCDGQAKGGLRSWSKGDAGQCRETLEILTATISEIVNGLEFDNAVTEKSHWSFEMATILTALSLRGEYESELNQDCDLYIFLRPFPSLNINLLFELICACGLELAFFKVVESIDMNVKLKLVSDCASYISEEYSFSENSVLKVGKLLTIHIQYLFLHDNGIHVYVYEGESEAIRKKALEIIEKTVTFMQKSILDDTSGTVSQCTTTVATFLIGLLNFTKASFNGCVLTCDILSEDVAAITDVMKSCDITTPSVTAEDTKLHSSPKGSGCSLTDTLQYEEFAHKYDLSIDAYCDVMAVLFRGEGEKEVQEQRLRRENSPAPDTINTSHLLTLLKNEDLRSKLASELNFAQRSENVVYASTARWHLSSILGVFLRKLCRGLDETFSCVNSSALNELKEDKSRLEVFKAVQNELKSEVWSVSFAMSDEVRFNKALVAVGEKLLNWEKDLNWLLVECAEITDPRWITCLASNAGELGIVDNTMLLWDRLVGLTNGARTPEMDRIIPQIRELFLSAFKRLGNRGQNLLLSHVFHSKEKLVEIFDLDRTRVFARLTVLMNRLVELEPSGDVVNEISTLALQCPEVVIIHLVRNAVQNQKQCDVITSLLHRLNALIQFRSQANDEEYVYECIRNVLRNSGDFSEKEQRDFIYFVMKGVCLPTENDVFNPVKNEPQLVEEVGSEMPDKPTPLLNFVYVWSRVISHVIRDVGDGSDVASMFYDESYELCLKVMATVLRKNKYRTIDTSRKQDAILVALLMNVCELLVGWEEVVSPENVCLLGDCKKYLLEIHSNLCHLLQWNFTHKSGIFHCFQFHWLLINSKLFPWHMKGYLLPFLQAFFNATEETKDYANEHGLPLEMYVPQDVACVLDLGESLSTLLTSEIACPENHWVPVLKLAIISDDMCGHVCRGLKASLMKTDLDYEHLFAAMLEVLPKCIDIEWIRVATFLQALSRNSAKFQQSTIRKANPIEHLQIDIRFESLQTEPILMLFDVVLVLLDSHDIDLGTESHLLKCFTRALFSCLDRSPSKEERSVDAKTSFSYYLQMCLLVGRVSEPAQEHLVGVLLELLEMTVKNSNEIFLDGSAADERVLKSVHDIVPKNIRNVLFKKLAELRS